MEVNVALLALFLFVTLSLVGIEAYTAIRGIPTISERLQWLGRAAPLVPLTAALAAGILLTHFFAC